MIFEKNKKNISIDSISQRFSEFLETKNNFRPTVAEWFGVTPQNISSITTGKSNLTIKQVLILKEQCPELNISWLLFGKGKMWEEPKNIKHVNYQERIEELNEIIEELKADKKRLVKMNEYLFSIIEEKS